MHSFYGRFLSTKEDISTFWGEGVFSRENDTWKSAKEKKMTQYGQTRASLDICMSDTFFFRQILALNIIPHILWSTQGKTWKRKAKDAETTLFWLPSLFLPIMRDNTQVPIPTFFFTVSYRMSRRRSHQSVWSSGQPWRLPGPPQPCVQKLWGTPKKMSRMWEKNGRQRMVTRNVKICNQPFNNQVARYIRSIHHSRSSKLWHT